MDQVERTAAQFADSWLARERSEIGSKEWHSHEWVVTARINWACDNPKKLWQAIEIIADHTLTSLEISSLGSGPIEALLAENFDTFCPLVTAFALTSATMRKALKSTWLEEEQERQLTKMLLLNENQLHTDRGSSL